ncbi:hypothetical protein F4861DRAFT_237627 [Xylaria intraflava]|nr:hypothetical protein F4861DRAFT_237627 [Xylaria intraflava]
MAPAISGTSAEPTLYEVLSLTPKQLEGQASSAQQKTIKQAYRKALLRHHPDKKPPGSPVTSTLSPSPSSSSPPNNTQSKPSGAKSSSSASKSQSTYTIDQIQDAYSVLSDARQRREYDRQLLLNPSTTSPSHTRPASTRFHTGIETVDLDDLDYDERTGLYYGSCRCGNDRGFQFTEAQLAEHEDDLVLTVQCLDCSLWMRVLFDAAEDSEDEQQPPQRQEQSPTPTHSTQAARSNTAVSPPQASDPTVHSGTHSISSSGKAWNFNLSFDWGISLSSPAPTITATTATTTTTKPPPSTAQRDKH